jgi:hypothetical protein
VVENGMVVVARYETIEVVENPLNWKPALFAKYVAEVVENWLNWVR